MTVNIEDIKKLRNSTGAGMMDAKIALTEAKGDFEKAVELLRQKGAAKATKKAERETRAGLIGSYVHMGRVGVLIEVNCETDFVVRTEDFQELTRNLSMQIAATNPSYVRPDDIPQTVIDKEKAIYATETAGKPPEIAEKITAGKLERFYSEVCLLKQPYVKDTDRTIEAYVQEVVARLGENIAVRRFTRMELGEING